MTGYSFDNFVVHEVNQAAYDVCKKLAALDRDVPRLIVLLGESGSGKTHLLWAIVNHFRKQKVKVGVAVISSTDFPDRLKKLPERPEILMREHPFFLMVDGLQQFEQEVAALERVLLAFREYNQPVIVATNAHPQDLPLLSDNFKAYMNSSMIVELTLLPNSGETNTAGAAPNPTDALQEPETALETEAQGLTPVQLEVCALKQELELVKQERDAAHETLDNCERELLGLRQEYARLQAEALPDEQSVKGIADRLNKQKATLEQHIASLELQLEKLIDLTKSIVVMVPPESVFGENSAVATAREETGEGHETTRIPDNQQHLDKGGGAATHSAGMGRAQRMLATIAGQLRSLEKESEENETGNTTDD